MRSVLTAQREVHHPDPILGLVGDAPVDWFQPFIDVALIQEIKELSNAEAGRLVEERELLAKEGP